MCRIFHLDNLPVEERPFQGRVKTHFAETRSPAPGRARRLLLALRTALTFGNASFSLDHSANQTHHFGYLVFLRSFLIILRCAFRCAFAYFF